MGGILIMCNWNVTITGRSYKQLKKLPAFVQNIADEAISALEQEGANPKYWDVKKTGKGEYRVRLNYRYRMRYLVESRHISIEVFYIGHRKNAYSS